MRFREDGAPGRFRVSPHPRLAMIEASTSLEGASRMSLLDTFRHRLAERRQRRQRYAHTLEILSLPAEIQRDIVRPEDETAPDQRRRDDPPGIAA